MSYLETVLNVPLPGSFTYTTDMQDLVPGIRVEVQFGKRKMTAVVVSVSKEFHVKPGQTLTPDMIKPINRIIDKEPVVNEELIQLSAWLSRYYLCSWGEALCAMIPGGRRGTDAGTSFFDEADISATRHTLSDEQQLAVEGILSPVDEPGTKSGTSPHLHYLYGQTGSGKTEVFLGAAEKVLVQGKGVIYLVPEIGLTQQVIEAVMLRFGKTAAVLHSGLTASQRLSEWKRILNREARVVVGARSAVFAPVPDLGLIIMDEEHDSSYKSGNTPRYHARQVAMYRAGHLGIPLVMGSATPSVEAWHLMSTGAIRKYTLTRRLAGGSMPEVEVVDLTKQASLSGCLSDRLSDEIRDTLNENRQVILFLNRRGFTHFFKCNTCGYELKCRNCSVALTYHKNEGRLRCHYCGYSVPVPSQCPDCQSLDVGYSGFGTEFIEEEVRAKFPLARIDRIDTDVLQKKGELQKKINDFKAGKTDILLGTQMVAKGLNFPGLKLVGVILADTGLHLPDFRAAERTFSLMVQVAGRAGRFFPDGKVIVQSYSPKRPAIALACTNDIGTFYEQELSERRILGFPPFSRLLRIVFRSMDRNLSEDAAESAASILEEIRETIKTDDVIEILGPSECPLEQIATNHRQQILLRSQHITSLQNIVSRFLYGYRTPSGVYTEIDVDPVNLL